MHLNAIISDRPPSSTPSNAFVMYRRRFKVLLIYYVLLVARGLTNRCMRGTCHLIVRPAAGREKRGVIRDGLMYNLVRAGRTVFRPKTNTPVLGSHGVMRLRTCKDDRYIPSYYINPNARLFAFTAIGDHIRSSQHSYFDNQAHCQTTTKWSPQTTSPIRRSSTPPARLPS